MPDTVGIQQKEFCRLRRQIMEREFSRMNDMQREAVFATEGALLILAGAGSGKTTVLVNRIANVVKYGKAYESGDVPAFLNDGDMALLKKAADGKTTPDEAAHVAELCAVDPCPAWRVLAITFTNKAAGELKDRLSRMLGEAGDEVQASTFHSFCARILRRDAERLGYTSHFTIYDSDDSKRLMKDCMKTLNIEEKVLSHKAVLAEIGRAKDSLLTPDRFAAQAGSDFRLKQVAGCYALYQRRLKEADAMDFDDLLFQTVTLFQTCPDVLDRYQKRFRYLMVDEYQDTNHAQYQFVSLLAAASGNLCVVGDDDQSIYKFRGATIENILSFEQQYKNCRVIRLEQNYRSTKNILKAANAVIEKNYNRKGKTLWTQNPEGDKLSLHTLENEDEESRFIADTVQDGVSKGKRYSDFAVLYRANAQSNAIERAMVKSAIPYRIIGGHRFFDTKEVRDAMAYLKIINNPNDSVALRRIINEPKRGIGDATVDKAAGIADGLGISLYEVLSQADQYADISRSAGKLKLFTDMVNGLREMSGNPENSIHLLYTAMLEATGYLKMWELAGEEEAGRVENLKELASSIQDYEKNSPDDFPELAGFLEEAALMTDADNYDAGAEAVVLMTMHSAKGLEFPVVFLPGFEDGVFPNMATIMNPDEMEEDRRLCYVAITRARENLYITNAESRMLYGQTTHNRPSRFLADIPEDVVEMHSCHAGYMNRSDKMEFDHFFKSASTISFASSGSSAPVSPASTSKNAGNTRGRRRVGFDGGGISAEKFTAEGFPARPSPADGTPGTLSEKAAPTAGWKTGDKVLHKVFGRGEVLSVTPMGNDSLLQIRFEKTGVKKIMANFAKLEPATAE